MIPSKRSFDQIQAFCPIPLTLIWHKNTRSYLSFRKEKKHLSLRLHQLFFDSSDAVYEALFSFIFKKDPVAKALLRKTAQLYFAKTQIPPRPLSAQGRVYHLGKIYQSLKEKFFSPDYHAVIGWSKRAPKSRFRHITFGIYDRQRRQIRIHPLLDDPQVPFAFVEFIVYHEMLHGICHPVIDARGHSRCHTPEFRKLEKLYPRYEEAKTWEKKSLQFFKKQAPVPKKISFVSTFLKTFLS